MVKPRLLIVEDDEGLCSQYRWAFLAYDVILSHTRQQARALAMRDDPSIVIMDLGLPPDPHGVSEGFAALEELSAIAPRSKIIVVTCHTAAGNAPRAFTLGAYDFHEKPVGIDVLRTIVARAAVDRVTRPRVGWEAEPRYLSPFGRFMATARDTCKHAVRL
jgi:two-component system NtrC family response regulator